MIYSIVNTTEGRYRRSNEERLEESEIIIASLEAEDADIFYSEYDFESWVLEPDLDKNLKDVKEMIGGYIPTDFTPELLYFVLWKFPKKFREKSEIEDEIYNFVYVLSEIFSFCRNSFDVYDEVNLINFIVDIFEYYKEELELNNIRHIIKKLQKKTGFTFL